MRRYQFLLAAGFCVVSAAALAADAKLTQVFDPPRLPEDARLKKIVHLNNPAGFKPEFRDRAEWEKRANEVREQVLVANGLWPLPEKTPLNAVIHGKIDRDEYTIEKVFFASYPGHYVCGNLYRPKGRSGKLPAVLCPHGHLPNGRHTEYNETYVQKELKLNAEKTAEGARYPTQAKCAMLARLGCVVFHYDMVGYSDSLQIKHREGFADAEAELRLQSFMGLQTWNSVRALDFLTALPDVDPARVGVTGSSGGGTQTFILCAIDNRPAISVPVVMVSAAMQGGCICENCSHLRVGVNNIELAALYAPKPQGLIAANDWTREIETKGLPELKSVYGLYGAGDKILAKYYPFEHNYNQVSRELMYNWMNQHLQLGFKEPIAEKPFVPVPIKELSVFNDEYPRPKDATDAAGLRQHLTKASDQQLAELAKNPDEYRRVVGTALEVIVHDRSPLTDKVRTSGLKEIKADGFAVHQTTLTRDAGEQIPSVGLIPNGFNGTIVIWAHPSGKASMLQESGKPTSAVQKLLDHKMAVLAIDPFLTGEFHLPRKPTPAPWQEQEYHKGIPYAGYFYGYNRSLLANRVHDLLTAVGFAKRAKAVHLVAFDKAGPWALLARALSGKTITKAVIDLDGFDFDKLEKVTDEMMLPGALKYGGIYGYVPLCNSGETTLFNARKTGQYALAEKTPGVKLHASKATPEEMVELLLK